MEDIINAVVFEEDDDLEDDDADDILVLDILNDDNLGNRAEIYGRFSLDEMSNIEAKSNFRFDKADIPRLSNALGIPELITTQENITLSGVTGLCILLRSLAYLNRLVDLEPMFGYSSSALSSICFRTVDIISENKGNLLGNLGNVPWLNEAKLQEYSQDIAQKGAPMENIWALLMELSDQYVDHRYNNNSTIQGTRKYIV